MPLQPERGDQLQRFTLDEHLDYSGDYQTATFYVVGWSLSD